MTMLKFIAIALLTLTSNTWAGSYYSCTDANGKKSFQAMPCSGASESKLHEYNDTQPSAQQSSYEPPAQSEEMNAVTTKYQTLMENERQNLSRLRDERAALN